MDMGASTPVMCVELQQSCKLLSAQALMLGQRRVYKVTVAPAPLGVFDLWLNLVRKSLEGMESQGAREDCLISGIPHA